MSTVPQHIFAFVTADGLRGIGCSGGDIDRPRFLMEGSDLRPLLPLLAAGQTEFPWDKAPPLQGQWRYVVPVANPSKILCVGQSYAKHAAEMAAVLDPSVASDPSALYAAARAASTRSEPIFFAKLPSCLIACGDAITIPSHLANSRIDYEGELAIVIGRRDYQLAPSAAHSIIAGYTIANDVTARDLQHEAKSKGEPWLWAKSQDTFCPFGPSLIPRDAIDAATLELSVHVDGELRQHAFTRELIWNVDELVAFASRHATLEPGDLVLTGTPPGVGPLNAGQTVAVSISRLGTLENSVATPQCGRGA